MASIEKLESLAVVGWAQIYHDAVPVTNNCSCVKNRPLEALKLFAVKNAMPWQGIFAMVHTIGNSRYMEVAVR